MALVSALAHSIPFPQLSIWLLISPCAHTFFWILESLSTRVTRLILNYLNGEVVKLGFFTQLSGSITITPSIS